MQPWIHAISRTANICRILYGQTTQYAYSTCGYSFCCSNKVWAEPHPGNVSDDERGDGEPEHELQRLDPLPAKLPALIKRPHPKPGVDERGAIKHDRDRKELPECAVVVHACGERIDRNVAERVIEEMADEIREQYDPASQTDLPEADAADCARDPFPGKSNHAIRSNTHCQGIDDSRVLFHRRPPHLIVDTCRAVGEKAS